MEEAPQPEPEAIVWDVGSLGNLGGYTPLHMALEVGTLYGFIPVAEKKEVVREKARLTMLEDVLPFEGGTGPMVRMLWDRAAEKARHHAPRAPPRLPGEAVCRAFASLGPVFFWLPAAGETENEKEAHELVVQSFSFTIPKTLPFASVNNHSLYHILSLPNLPQVGLPTLDWHVALSSRILRLSGWRVCWMPTGRAVTIFIGGPTKQGTRFFVFRDLQKLLPELDGEDGAPLWEDMLAALKEAGVKNNAVRRGLRTQCDRRASDPTSHHLSALQPA